MGTHDDYPDDFLLDVLRSVHGIAVVGASTKWNRPSAFVMKYLALRGFEIYPVNPRAAGQSFEKTPFVARLDEVPGAFQMVDIFRNSEAASGVVDEAIRFNEGVEDDPRKIKVIWMQLTVRNDEAAARAEATGMKVVMNRCPKIEWSRLNGELSWGGLNSNIVSSRRRRLRSV